MPFPNMQPIFCKQCGKLLKTETYSDVLTPEEWQRRKRKSLQPVCFTCTMKKWLGRSIK